MAGNEKKDLTNTKKSPKITPDGYLNCVKKEAKERKHGTLVIAFQIHDGEIRGAEVIETRKKLSPYW